MAVFKCKMCGGTLDIVEGQTVVTCDFCGTKQTIPSFNNEKKINLFKRANAHRFRNEFDKASGIYETIVSEFPNEAEAYWGLVLCRFGIEYVDDPRTGEKIPTCHRTQYDSIFEDSDYKNAIKNADVLAKEIYQSEAEKISLLQKDILEISSQEEPFDVFICYKETDEYGERTPDSVLAQDIYDELTNQGYRVFFSRITLEDKLGSQYEPYIFAALHSARIMLHITTNTDYSESVWVRNEWSRFLDLTKSGQKKTLIPCYKNMSAYDLPVEMQNLQGQDMGKLGATQDLLRGINKILQKDSKKGKAGPEVKLSVEEELFESHLKKGYLYLSKKMWDEAIQDFNDAIKIIDKCGRAHIGLMLAQAHEVDIDSFLLDKGYDCEELSVLEVAESCADEQCKKELEEIKKKIADLVAVNHKSNFISILDDENWIKAKDIIENEQDNKKEFIELYKKSLYEATLNKLRGDLGIGDLSFVDTLISRFEELGDYNDSKSLIEEAKNKKIEIVKEYEKECFESLEFELPSKDDFNAVEFIIKKLIQNKATRNKYNAHVGSDSFDEKYNEIEEEALKAIFTKSQIVVSSTSSFVELTNLKNLLGSLNRKTYFEPVFKAISTKEQNLMDNIRKSSKKRKTKLFIKILIIVGIIAALTGTVVGVVFGVDAIVKESERAQKESERAQKESERVRGIELMEKGSYDEAIALFLELDGFGDTARKIDVCKGLQTLEESITLKKYYYLNAGIYKILNVKESVFVTYISSEGIEFKIQSQNFNDSDAITQLISDVNFKFYSPEAEGYSFAEWHPTEVKYKENLTYLTLDSVWNKIS